MPTLLSAISPSDVKVRWQEPYLTEALNERASTVINRGIYRGFLMYPFGGRALRIVVDPDTLDSVAECRLRDYSIVLVAGTDFDVRVRLTGTVNITLPGALDGTTVLIALYAYYVSGSATAASIVYLTQVEWAAFTEDQKRDYVVLGTVDAKPVLADVDVHADKRTYAWTTTAAGNVSWRPLLKNPGFEWGMSGAGTRIPSWTAGIQQNATDCWDLSGASHSGNVAVRVSTLATGGGLTVSGFLKQSCDVDVVSKQVSFSALTSPADKLLLRVSAWICPIQTLLGGAIYFAVSYTDTTGASSYLTVDITSAVAVAGAYRLVEHTFALPATPRVTSIRSISLVIIAADYGMFVGSCMDIDDFQAELETWGAEDNTGLGESHFELRTEQLAFDTYKGVSSGLVKWSGAVYPIGAAAIGVYQFGDADGTRSTTSPVVEAGGLVLSNSTAMGWFRPVTSAPRHEIQLLSAAGTFTLSPTLVLPQIRLDSTLGSETARLYVDGSTSNVYNAVSEGPTKSGLSLLWREGTDPLGVVKTVNAKWTEGTSLWTYDIASPTAARFQQHYDGFRFSTYNGVNSWADSAWKVDAVISDGLVQFPYTVSVGQAYNNALVDNDSMRLQFDTGNAAAGKAHCIAMINTDIGLDGIHWYADTSSDSLWMAVGSTYSNVAGKWTGAAASYVLNVDPSSGLVFQGHGPGVNFLYAFSGAVTIDPLNKVHTFDDGIIQFSSGFALSNTNPAAGAAVTANAAYAKNLVKAWAAIKVHGTGGGTPTITVLDSFNVGSVIVKVGTGNTLLTVSFGNNFAASDRFVVCGTCYTAAMPLTFYESRLDRTTGSTTLGALVLSTGLARNLDIAADVYLDIQVIGEQ